MSIVELIDLLIPVTAVFGYLNHRFIRLPDTTGIAAVGVAMSLLLTVAGLYMPELTRSVRAVVAHVDFSEVVLHVLLGPLLFAGSLSLSMRRLAGRRWRILGLATGGVVLTVAALGLAYWSMLGVFGFALPLIAALLFGAVIAPTDPIAVLGLLRAAGVPRKLQTDIVGESLFNDGTGVVAFAVLLSIASGATHVGVGPVALLLARQVIGGAVVGSACAWLAARALRRVDSFPVEILLTLSLPTAGYALADSLGVSAPLAAVFMGLVIGNAGGHGSRPPRTRQRLMEFWEFTDDLLNLALYGLIGLALVLVPMTPAMIGVALLAIPLALAARMLSVVGILGLLHLAGRRHGGLSFDEAQVLTWGGLRGGLAIALVLSLPGDTGSPLLVLSTYAVVLFSLLVQAPTLPRLLRRVRQRADHMRLTS